MRALCLGLLLCLLSLGLIGPAFSAPATATVETCFTPGMDCRGYLVSVLNSVPAGASLYIQAYSFTDAGIAKAVIDASRRGVKTFVLLDKSQLTEKYSSATFFANAQVPLAIDTHEAIAHNKVIIVPELQLVVTGSFNFTKSAQERNAENLVMLTGSPDLVQRYLRNFHTHWDHSQPGPSAH